MGQDDLILFSFISEAKKKGDERYTHELVCVIQRKHGERRWVVCGDVYAGIEPGRRADVVKFKTHISGVDELKGERAAMKWLLKNAAQVMGCRPGQIVLNNNEWKIGIG